MKKLYVCMVMVTLLMVVACTNDNTETETTAMPIECDLTFTETTNEQIPVETLSSDTSTIEGDVQRFLNYCHEEGDGDLSFTDALIKTHQFTVSLDKVYPVREIRFLSDDISELSVDVSMNGKKFTRVYEDIHPGDMELVLDDVMLKYIRFTFPRDDETVRLKDLDILLGSGLIIDDASPWRDVLFRYEGWTGADGIFSFELDGDPGFSEVKDNIGFIFSDTIIGDVSTRNHLRNQKDIINNSFGYYDESADIKEGFEFIYGGTRENPRSLFPPDAYIGYHPGNLLSVEGLSSYHNKNATLTNTGPGVMWQAPMQEELTITIDLYAPQSLKTITLWNANANPDIGVKRMSLYAGNDKDQLTFIKTIDLQKATGSNEENATLFTAVSGIEARYVRFVIEESYDDTLVGLGKILLQDENDQPLFGLITASFDPAVFGNETSARLWFQDGIVIGDTLYLFPLVVKDDEDIFRVTEVGMVEVPIADGRIEPGNAIYKRSPLQSITPSGDMIYYGAGIMDNTDVDGYVYLYGYRDDDSGRHLIVARTTKECIGNFNTYMYYDGTDWSNSINDSAPLIEGVSPELSVTKMPFGRHKGKYVLYAMENTTSGRIVRSLADSPIGPFSDFELLYKTNEGNELRGAFTYNAKLHPALSTENGLIVSYNVNTHITSALVDADIYYPRFLIITETKDSE